MDSRRVSALLLGLCALAAAGGFTLGATPADASPEKNPAAVAVRALVSGSAEEARAAVPEDFAAVHGYRPVIENGHLVRADGDCSSPVPLPEGFVPACRQHDYGYDLLRYAQHQGEPLGRWARGAIDDQFADYVGTLCDDGPAEANCRRMSVVAATGVELNSLRQGDGVPEESLLTHAALASSAVGTLGLAGAVARRRGRR